MSLFEFIIFLVDAGWYQVDYAFSIVIIDLGDYGFLPLKISGYLIFYIGIFTLILKAIFGGDE